MFKATCSECGDYCKVPFKPTGSKPIFCSDCFERQGGGRSDRSAGRREFGGGRRDRGSFGGDREMHDAICADCGRNCQVPFRPTPGKDIFCNNCFGKNGGDRKRSNNSNSGEVMQEIKKLNTKIDKLFNLLYPGSVTRHATGQKKESKSVVKKAKSKKTFVKKEETDIFELKPKKTVEKKVPKEKTVKKAAKKKVAKNKAEKKTAKKDTKRKEAKKKATKKKVAKKKTK